MNEIDHWENRLRKHLPQSHDLTLITLKGHLLLEEVLDSIIKDHCKDKEALDGVEIGFYVKLKLSSALVGDPNISYAWQMVERLNSLRNALAHRLDHPLTQKRLQAFLALFNGSREHPLQTGNAAVDLTNNIAFLIGLLCGATGQVKLPE